MAEVSERPSERPGDHPSERPVLGPIHGRERLWHLRPRQWAPMAGRVLHESARDRVTTAAAGLAFHGFLALLPVAIATVGLLNVVGLSGRELHTLVHATSVLLPTQMSRVLTHDLLRPPSRLTNVLQVVFGLLVAIWSSIEAMAAIQVALDVAYEVPRDRGLIGRRVMAVPLLAMTLGLGGVASVLLVLGAQLDRLVPGALHPVLGAVRYGGSFVLVTLLLSALYALGPAREQRVWDWVSPGGVAAAAAWVLASLGFSFYVDHFGHESRAYGVLGGVAVTLLWLFLTAVIVLVGAEINRELERMAGTGAEGSPGRPGGGRAQGASTASISEGPSVARERSRRSTSSSAECARLAGTPNPLAISTKSRVGCWRSSMAAARVPSPLAPTRASSNCKMA